ncbi:ABC transporter ATP-binding protein [Celeribacter sp.]|uniref:iron ABC transporter ATP-binding protein n=1 Tax=Celeribacter sp. TaxID=1890673 RepID=UPI003A8E74E1
MIRIENLSHKIGENQILDDISLELPKGGITALVGPNGAGKSSLLARVARLEPIQSGRIFVDELEVGRCANDVLARRLSILPQSGSIAPRLTVKELIGFGRYPYHKGRPTEADRAMVEAAIAAFDLGPLAARPLDTLSGGQKQRALVAMTYAQDTDYILLDEPLNNLDIAASRQLMLLLRDLAGNHGKTIVIVLHDLNVACSYADHLVAMDGGRVATTGTPRDIVNLDLVQSVFLTDAAVHHIDGRPVVVV